MSNAYAIDPSLKTSDFLSKVAPTPLRVCCYGSSSSATPDKYLREAHALGYSLAKRGHTCVNGAGSFGCMAALNDGAAAGDGHIVGVIHEMFLVDGKDDWCVRDGGAHNIFSSSASSSSSSNVTPKREMLVAGGDDLQERKKLLVQGADALAVLPGGPGTWDELWEMACARNIGLSNLPIVVINVDGYYEPFRQMIERAYADELIKMKPENLVHFVPSAEEAVVWIEQQQGSKKDALAGLQPKLQKRASVLKRSSFMDNPSVINWFRSRSDSIIEEESHDSKYYHLISLSVPFIAGVIVGMTLTTKRF